MALSRRSGFGTCANKLKRPLDFDTSLFQNGDDDGGAPPRSRLKCRGGAARPVAASPLRALARLAIAYSRVDTGLIPLAAPIGKLIAEETEKWGKVIRAAGIKGD